MLGIVGVLSYEVSKFVCNLLSAVDMAYDTNCCAKFCRNLFLLTIFITNCSFFSNDTVAFSDLRRCTLRVVFGTTVETVVLGGNWISRRPLAVRALLTFLYPFLDITML